MSNITKEFDKNVFSTNLKFLMHKNNLKNKDLASSLGLSKSAISNYIAGTSIPRTDVLSKMAEVFGVPIETLIKKLSDDSTLRESGTIDSYQVPIFSKRLVSSDIIYRNDNYNGYITFPFPLCGDMDCYALLVSDNLLASSGIVEKSIVIFASKLEAQNGELAAVFLKNEMKIVVRRIVLDKNKVVLITDESECTFKSKGRTDEITILGKVISATFSPNALKR